MKGLAVHWVCSVFVASAAWAGPFDATQPGFAELAAIPANDPRIRGWASGFVAAQTGRGPIDITDPTGPLATFGTPASALGVADAIALDGFPSLDPTKVISLGDGGFITLSFDVPIRNGAGADFAVFENAFNDTFLELAFVEVSSNGSDFFRFPTVSLTPLTAQIDQTDPLHDKLDPSNLDGFAGKYRAGLGTPFDLQRLVGSGPLLDVDGVRFVRIRDVIGYIGGSVAAGTATQDSAQSYAYFGLNFAQNHLVNDPYLTDFASGGFDLDAVAVLHFVPEPGVAWLLIGVLASWAFRRDGGRSCQRALRLPLR